MQHTHTHTYIHPYTQCMSYCIELYNFVRTDIYVRRQCNSIPRHSIVLLIFYYHLRNKKVKVLHIQVCSRGIYFILCSVLHAYTYFLMCYECVYMSQGNFKRFSVWFRCSYIYSFFSPFHFGKCLLAWVYLF